MTEPLERTRQEFTRQAAQFAASAAINEARQTVCFVDAIGAAATGAIVFSHRWHVIAARKTGGRA